MGGGGLIERGDLIELLRYMLYGFMQLIFRVTID